MVGVEFVVRVGEAADGKAAIVVAVGHCYIVVVAVATAADDVTAAPPIGAGSYFAAQTSFVATV